MRADQTTTKKGKKKVSGIWKMLELLSKDWEMTAQFFEKYGYFDTDYVLLNMPGDDEKLWDFFWKKR